MEEEYDKDFEKRIMQDEFNFESAIEEAQLKYLEEKENKND